MKYLTAHDGTTLAIDTAAVPMASVQALPGKVMVLANQPPSTGKFGIVLVPDEKPILNEGMVFSVGEGCEEYVSVGDMINYHQFAGEMLQLLDEEGVPCLGRCVKLQDILCVQH